LEMVVSAGIFALVLEVVSGVFITSLISQKQSYGLKRAQEDGRYIMEFLEKEARMAQYNSACAGSDIFKILDSGQELKFTTSSGQCVNYKFSGNQLWRNGEPMNSNLTKISQANFSESQGLLNYSFDISYLKGNYTININSSVSSRAK